MATPIARRTVLAAGAGAAAAGLTLPGAAAVAAGPQRARQGHQPDPARRGAN